MALTTISAFFATYLVRSGWCSPCTPSARRRGRPRSFILISVALFLDRPARTAFRHGRTGRDRKPRRVPYPDLVALLALSLIILIATAGPCSAPSERDRHGPRPATSSSTSRMQPRRGGPDRRLTTESVCPVRRDGRHPEHLPVARLNGGVRNMRKLLLVVCSFIGAAAAMYSSATPCPSPCSARRRASPRWSA